jgi:ribose transport system ATP-binding protein
MNQEEDKNSQLILEMNGITKSYPGVVALDNVTFHVKKGEIHALLGANGAGKSTLMKVLCGVTTPDTGEIILSGEKVTISNPASAIKLGISYVPQELSLVPTMNARHNILLGQEPTLGKPISLIDEKRLTKLADQSLEYVNLKIDTNIPVKNLSVSDQQMIAIAMALYRQCKIIILDEPTSSLSSAEISKLFEIMQKLRQEGHTIIFITHLLDEVFFIADRISILRDAVFQGCFNKNEVSREAIVSLMTGKKDEKIGKRSSSNSTTAEVLRLENVTTGKISKDISFSVHSGEILGLFGQVGSGRTEVLRAIFGADRLVSGEIHLFGEKVKFFSPISAIKNGIGFITEDRKNQGLILSMDLSDNISMGNYEETIRFGLIHKKKLRQIAEQYRESLNIKTRNIDIWTKFLSGGNQQKVILAKWLNHHSKILLMDEPTKGIDVGSKQEFYTLIQELADRGVAILLVSSEISEIMGLCDRVLIFNKGKIIGEADPRFSTKEELMAMTL